MADRLEELNDFEFYLHAGEFNNRPRVPRVYLRDAGNPLETLNEQQFFYRYRFTKFTVRDVIFPLVAPDLENDSQRGLPLLPILKLLLVLRFFATSSFQIVCGDLARINQATVSRLVRKVSTLFARLVPRFVRFPAPHDLQTVKQEFYERAHFPGVIGCIDCTHVPIVNPGRARGEQFRNRKGWFSLNVQVVAGPHGQIFDIVARWPGSVHDSRIFNNSSLKVKMEMREHLGLLLGDSGYAQTEYLFTPAPEPVRNQQEARYNRAHRSTRNCVERCFGTWKRRFPCLSRKLNTRLETSTLIIVACAVLHNLAVGVNEPVPDGHERPDVHQPLAPPHIEGVRGQVIRTAFINTHF